MDGYVQIILISTYPDFPFRFCPFGDNVGCCVEDSPLSQSPCGNPPNLFENSANLESFANSDSFASLDEFPSRENFEDFDDFNDYEDYEDYEDYSK